MRSGGSGLDSEPREQCGRNPPGAGQSMTSLGTERRSCRGRRLPRQSPGEGLVQAERRARSRGRTGSGQNAQAPVGVFLLVCFSLMSDGVSLQVVFESYE